MSRDAEKLFYGAYIVTDRLCFAISFLQYDKPLFSLSGNEEIFCGHINSDTGLTSPPSYTPLAFVSITDICPSVLEERMGYANVSELRETRF